MSKSLRYIAWIVVAVVALVIVLEVKSVFSPDAGEPQIVVPDSGFAPIVKDQYRPPSTPFEHPSNPVKGLPKGVSEKDVKRVVTITKKIPVRDSLTVSDTTKMIELKSGELFVERPENVEVVMRETRYLDPIFSFGVFAGVGVSIGKKVSPLGSISPLEILGTIRLPQLSVDLYGVAFGLSYQVGAFGFGAGMHWGFDLNRSIKATIQYSIN